MDPNKCTFDALIDRRNTTSMKWDNPMYQGKDMLPMPVADMDFKVCEPILARLRDIDAHGVLGYSLPSEELQILMQTKLLEDYQYPTELDWQVWIPGIVPGLTAAVAAIAQGGILTAVPVYHPFHLMADWLDLPLHTFPMREEKGRWVFDMEAMEAGLKAGADVFLLCHPHNPGGTVFNADELLAIRDLCQRYHCTILSDEIHADLRLFPQSPHLPMGRLDAQGIGFFALSKAYNIAAFGGAVAIIPDPDLRARFIKKTKGFFPMLSRHSIEAMCAAMKDGRPWLEELLVYLRDNHALLQSFVDRHPSLHMLPLEATYLAWISYDARLGNFQKALLEAGLHVLDGQQFLRPGFIRLNFACPRSRLQAALDIMDQVLKQHA